MSDGVASRVTAANVLEDVLHRGRSLKAALGSALPTLPDPRDRALVEAIVMTALRQRARMDAALAQWLQKPFGVRDHDLHALLLTGFAQLELGLPAHAAVDATVEAARAMKRVHQAGMVNALLRRAQREAIFAASAQEAPLWLRVNRRMHTRDAYLAALHTAGIPAQTAPDLADALRLEASLPVQQLPDFKDGAVSVQDGAAQAVADALAPAAHARVLDACAAPGGKAAHLAERDASLRITALDVDARRLRRMRETFTRLQLGIDVHIADATHTQAWWDGTPFDAILIDAPCSASGIVRRQPDVLLHRRETDVVALVIIQAQLLDALWPLLAPGGTLVYATCSIMHTENSASA